MAEKTVPEPAAAELDVARAVAADPDAASAVGRAFTELAAVLHARPELESVAQALVDAAPQVISGCDHASLMIVAGQGFRTLASSDEVAATVDRFEREVGTGPCVDAITEQAYQLDPDITVRSQWPRLAERVLAHTPVRGMAGYRLVMDGMKVAALNVFSDTANALTRESADTGAVLAAFASVAMTSSSQHRRAETLQAGLQSNREIGTAIGLLMAAHNCSREQAFETLRKASSDLNRKLSAVAHDVIDRSSSRQSQ